MVTVNHRFYWAEDHLQAGPLGVSVWDDLDCHYLVGETCMLWVTPFPVWEADVYKRERETRRSTHSLFSAS